MVKESLLKILSLNRKSAVLEKKLASRSSSVNSGTLAFYKNSPGWKGGTKNPGSLIWRAFAGKPCGTFFPPKFKTYEDKGDPLLHFGLWSDMEEKLFEQYDPIYSTN